jgi:epoxyqueuosine reductase
MAYLARNAHKRIDPQQVLPGAKSIVVLAVSYGGTRGQEARDGKQETEDRRQKTTSGQRASNGSRPVRFGVSPSGGQASEIPRSLHYRASDRLKAGLRTIRHPASGIVARYAQFQDYHDVVGTRLRSLTEFIKQIGGPEVRSLWYVDTGPILERDLAQRAGLGFVGKHTNLISRQLGNWLFLAEILTTLDLDPDQPEPNRCGSCVRCVSACPTGAITGPFQLDARRCISYLTIELKGSIPAELRPAVGNRIYGCDDCLAICPWNRFAREGALMQAHSRPDLNGPPLLELLSLDEPQFKRRFAGTPLLRTKRGGLLRNVCVALGNTADTTALPALERAASDPEPLVAEHAQWAIDQIRNRTTHPHHAGVDPT